MLSSILVPLGIKAGERMAISIGTRVVTSTGAALASSAVSKNIAKKEQKRLNADVKAGKVKSEKDVDRYRRRAAIKTGIATGAIAGATTCAWYGTEHFLDAKLGTCNGYPVDQTSDSVETAAIYNHFMI